MASFLDTLLGTKSASSTGPGSASKWNLIRGVYTQKNNPSASVVFFTESADGEERDQQTAIDQTADSGGRRLAIYEYPYQDGQKVKDLGGRGETHNFNIKFFGDNYQKKLDQFLKIVNTRHAGTLSHPTLSPLRGTIPVRFREYNIVHRSDEWNAVTIQAVFVDDNSEKLDSTPPKIGVDAALRNSVQQVVNSQSTISSLIDSVGKNLKLPSTIISQLQGRITAVANSKATLLGSLASTFNLKSAFTSLLSDAAGLAGGLFSISGGTTAGGAGTSAEIVGTTLPPAFQVGFDPVTQATVDAQQAVYASENKTTPQQAVFQANQVRQGITAAINEINDQMGNAGAEIVQEYRLMAISIQEAVEASLEAAQARTRLYTLPRTMSLRQVAYENGFEPDRGNEIESLNPYLPSVNFIPKGSVLSVPVA